MVVIGGKGPGREPSASVFLLDTGTLNELLDFLLNAITEILFIFRSPFVFYLIHSRCPFSKYQQQNFKKNKHQYYTLLVLVCFDLVCYYICSEQGRMAMEEISEYWGRP